MRLFVYMRDNIYAHNIMPFSLSYYSPRPHKRCYQVKNAKSGKLYSKCATKKNATKQLRLLRAITYNKNFVVRPRKNITRKRNTLRKQIGKK
jgi:hypothetical protein